MREQMVFKRYELKYLITRKQQEDLKERMKPHMIPDEYGQSTICNIYFDTPTFLLVRRSLEKGVFGTPLLSSDQVLMEVKTPFAVPLWMSGWLSRHQVYRTSFSKYGLAYQQMTEARGWSGNPARGITKAS